MSYCLFRLFTYLCSVNTRLTPRRYLGVYTDIYTSFRPPSSYLVHAGWGIFYRSFRVKRRYPPPRDSEHPKGATHMGLAGTIRDASAKQSQL